MRLLNITEGSIKLDGLDIRSIDPELLRSKIVTISQDIFKLPGTIRSNLDPTSHVSDTSLVLALQEVDLWAYLQSQGGLDADMDVVGLSQGQLQLFSLAKAILKPKTKLVLLDEVGSAVDAETKRNIIRKMVRQRFSGCTVLAVTHRPSSEDWDKIALIDRGRLVEFQQP
jgi:ATP-binding cassette subfamily C (CFTR/MRP) protein 1